VVFLKLKKIGMPVALYYLLWQAGVRIAMRTRLRQFDIIHHITFNSFRQPGFWWFCGKPVVLGPLGGGQTCPSSFLSLMRGRRFSEILRTTSVVLSPLLPHLWFCFASARLVLAANQDTEKRIPFTFRKKVCRLLETGVPEEKIREASPSSSDRGVQFLWLGWFIPIKAPELALRAFALARQRNGNIKLTMAGEGLLGPGLKELADNLGIGGAVDWPGKVPHTKVGELMAGHDVFLFTSLRDTSGNVLLEAMASGLPAVTLRHQGAAEIATDQTAIRVKPETIEQTVRDLADAMVKMAESREIRTRMGTAGRERIREEFAWNKQAEHMSRKYEEVLAKAGLSNCV
jgi:glycosyltransferase involved in cell wall biosynthesis